MKILPKETTIVIINDFDYIQGGASKVAIDTANILCNEYNVIFFSGDSKDTKELNNKVKKISTYQGEALKNKIKGFVNGIYNFKAKGELEKILKSLDKNKTIIHVHGWTKCLSSSIFDIIFKMEFKVVLTMHDYFTACPNGGYFNYSKNEICPLKPLSMKCLKCNCDSRNYFFKLYRILRQFVQNKIVKLPQKLTDVISLSDFSENILKNTLNENTKIHRVYNPIEYDNSVKNIDFNANDYYLYVGRISLEKGVDVFCEAVKKTGVKGIAVGDGPEKEKLEKMYPEILFVGWKKKQEVNEYMKKAKALIFPSKWYEVAPLTSMEALMKGLPCLVKEGNAAVEQIEEGKNGFIFKNIDELCDIILNKKLEKFKFFYKHNYKESILECYKNL